MEIFTSGLGIMEKGVQALGAIFVIIGLVGYGIAHKDDNAGGKAIAGSSIVGGLIIFGASTLVPMLSSFFSI